MPIWRAASYKSFVCFFLFCPCCHFFSQQPTNVQLTTDLCRKYTHLKYNQALPVRKFAGLRPQIAFKSRLPVISTILSGA